MTARTIAYAESIARSFERGQQMQRNRRRREGEEMLAKGIDDFSYSEGAKGTAAGIPTDLGQSDQVAPPAADSSVGTPTTAASVDSDGGGASSTAYGEGGDPANVDAIEGFAKKAAGAIADDTEVKPPQTYATTFDDVLRAQYDVPQVKLVDWEAYRKHRAEAYAKAGMPEKAAQVDAEVDEMKRQRAVSYMNQAGMMMDRDPAKAAKLLNIANQYISNGVQMQFMATPEGQLIAKPSDEFTGESMPDKFVMTRDTINDMAMMAGNPENFAQMNMERKYRDMEAKDRALRTGLLERRAELDDAELDLRYAEFRQDVQQAADALQLDYDKMDANILEAQMRLEADAREAAMDAGLEYDDIRNWRKDVSTILGDPDKIAARLGMEEALDDTGKLELITMSQSWVQNARNMSAEQAVDMTLTVMNGVQGEDYILSKDSRHIKNMKTGEHYVLPTTMARYILGQGAQGIPETN